MKKILIFAASLVLTGCMLRAQPIVTYSEVQVASPEPVVHYEHRTKKIYVDVNPRCKYRLHEGYHPHHRSHEGYHPHHRLRLYHRYRLHHRTHHRLRHKTRSHHRLRHKTRSHRHKTKKRKSRRGRR